jgi:signal transduction histidine kinase
MKRLRILFALVAAALLVTTALLARRALRSVELERRARHESVAERLFDEMERALSGFLAAEEERAIGQYAYEYTPPGEPPGSLRRSPLAEPPALPFVIGYFQIDPDGGVRFPLLPEGKLAKADAPAQAAALSAQASAAIAEIDRAVGGYWRSEESGQKIQAATNAQAPGSTLALAGRLAAPSTEDKAIRDGRQAEQEVSAYDALRSLNKGAEQRAERQTKISREYASEADEELGSSASNVLGDSRAAGRLARHANERSREDRFELSPMVGRRIAERRLMLYRTVVHEQHGYRQGLLIDVDALGRWLEQQALAGSELASYATVTFAPRSASVEGDGTLAYQHRFAEPFEEISARLVLAALPGLGGGRSVYGLAVMSVFVVVAGLGALYRMLVVVVRYAEQRQNFVAAVTHELRTPLTAIRMYGEMLRDGMVASETKRDEYHRHITGESERLTRLVDNVLELSRLEKGTRRARLERGDVGGVVREVVELARPHAEAAGFTIRVDVEDDLPPVGFERDRLKQMLFNLLDNAVKYADGAAVKDIEIRCRRSGAGVVVAVRDRGPGVPTRHLRRIFEPFQRGENELTRRSKGTGLGLALVRGLASEMGARVSGVNRPDGGFEVAIEFP